MARRVPLDSDVPLGELMANPAARAVIERQIPELMKSPRLAQGQGGSYARSPASCPRC